MANDTEVERLWPVIANERALAINEAWDGEAGRLLKVSDTIVTVDCGNHAGKNQSFPSFAVWSKRLPKPVQSVAVLLVNVDSTPQPIDVTYAELLSAAGLQKGPNEAGAFVGTDVWSGKQLPSHVSAEVPWQETVSGHDSRFVVFSPLH